MFKKNLSNKKLKSLFWAPEFGHPNQYTGLPNGLDMSLITIITVKGIYCCIISDISKSDTIYFKNILCLMIPDLYKMHFKQIDIKK